MVTANLKKWSWWTLFWVFLGSLTATLGTAFGMYRSIAGLINKEENPYIKNSTMVAFFSFSIFLFIGGIWMVLLKTFDPCKDPYAIKNFSNNTN